MDGVIAFLIIVALPLFYLIHLVNNQNKKSSPSSPATPAPSERGQLKNTMRTNGQSYNASQAASRASRQAYVAARAISRANTSTASNRPNSTESASSFWVNTSTASNRPGGTGSASSFWVGSSPSGGSSLRSTVGKHSASAAIANASRQQQAAPRPSSQRPQGSAGARPASGSTGSHSAGSQPRHGAGTRPSSVTRPILLSASAPSDPSLSIPIFVPGRSDHWVCPFCETFNATNRRSCLVCGNNR